MTGWQRAAVTVAASGILISSHLYPEVAAHHNLDAFAQRFVGWGIPYPHISAAISGYTEWVGGILLMLGLLTRLVSILLMFNMFVALVKVKMKEVTGINDFAEMDEVLYMFILFWLMMAGLGRVSVDHLLWRSLRLGQPAEGVQTRPEEPHKARA